MSEVVVHLSKPPPMVSYGGGVVCEAPMPSSQAINHGASFIATNNPESVTCEDCKRRHAADELTREAERLGLYDDPVEVPDELRDRVLTAAQLLAERDAARGLADQAERLLERARNVINAALESNIQQSPSAQMLLSDIDAALLVYRDQEAKA